MLNRSKTTSVESYRKATALECLVNTLFFNSDLLIPDIVRIPVLNRPPSFACINAGLRMGPGIIKRLILKTGISISSNNGLFSQEKASSDRILIEIKTAFCEFLTLEAQIVH